MATHKLYNGSVTIKFDGRRHLYTYEEEKTADGSPLMIAGVTSILSRAAKQALIPWASGMAADYFRDCLLDGYDISNPEANVTYSVAEVNNIHKDAKGAYRRKAAGAANVGKMVHGFAEAFLKGDKVPDQPKAKLSVEDRNRYDNGVAAFKKWAGSHDIELWDAERILFSKRWIYCGTCDFFGKIDGEVCVLDFKTSSGLYADMALQVAAYSLALEEELGMVIPAKRLARFDKETGQLHTMRIPRNKEHEEAFLALREYAEKISRIERSWTVI